MIRPTYILSTKIWFLKILFKHFYKNILILIFIKIYFISELKFDWQKQKKMLKTFLILILLINNIYAGPAAGAICSAGCAAVVVACYGAAGVVFGK